VQQRVSCEAAHIFMYETPARENVHLPCYPITSGMLSCWYNIGLVLAYKHLCNLFRECITIVDNFTSPSIYNVQLLDPELIPRLCEDMIADVTVGI